MPTQNRSLYLIPCILLVAFGSCEFEPKKRYEPERDENRPPPEILINELSFEQDTIFAYFDQLLSFNFSTVGDEEVLAVRILLDEEEYGLVMDSAGSVGFNHEWLPEGPHVVELEIYTTSLTGSIADQLEEELYVFSASWILYIMKDYHHLNVGIEDGLLRFDWDEYLGSDFVDYLFGPTYMERVPLEENHYRAVAHIGQMASYHIWARTIGRDAYIEMASYQTYFERPEIKRFTTDSATFMIHWNKPKYYGALEEIQLWESYWSYSQPNALVKRTNDFNDTIFHVQDVKHNEQRSYRLVLIGKYPGNPYSEEPAVLEVNKNYVFLTE